MPKTFVFMGVLILAVTSSAGAQAKAPDPSLQAAIEARQKAIDTRNGTGWSQYTADDFVRINVDGSIVGRSQQLKAMTTNTSKPTAVTVDRIQMFGPDAAVTTQYGQSSTSGSIRITSFWVRQNGAWRVVTSVFTPNTPK